MDLREAFERHDDEFLHFERINGPRHQRPDLCAFLMLDDIAPSKFDMVSSAEHDEIWLEVDIYKLSEVATDELIRDLVRCGIRYDDDVESLAMYV